MAAVSSSDREGGLEHDRDARSIFYGEDKEDTDGSICPVGCRHQKDEMKGCSETFATVIVGGIPKILQEIELMEIPSSKKLLNTVDTPGTNHAYHSMILPCERCKKLSLVSWTSYTRNIGLLPQQSAEKALPHVEIKSAPEYYTHVLLTGNILTTPNFSLAKERGNLRPPVHTGKRGTNRELRAVVPEADRGERRDGRRSESQTFAAELADLCGVASLDRALKRKNRTISH